MKYVAINYMGSTPATSYQDSKLICLNADQFFLYPSEIRKFIALHEEGHIVLDTDSEIEADNYAFKKFNGTLPTSHRWSILALSRILPFTTKDQYKRLLNMIKNALIAERYEEAGSTSYEMSEIDAQLEELNQMNDQEWAQQNALDPVSGEMNPMQGIAEPVGPFVSIAREVWTKSKLGYPLTGYDLTILDKYPIPSDFEAYEVDRSEIMDLSGLDQELPEENQEKTANTTKGLIKKLPWWIWLVTIIFIVLLIPKK